jgi:glyoxylase-like metal-dependent hydrolase (beta-lactamase superfamily II)
MAARQEQEEASTEVTEVAPNVLRMQLPISMPGLGHVNCYALLDDEGAAVVDPGLPTPSSFRALQDRLRQAGLAVKNVHTVLVTHSHADHFGGAGRILRESGGRMIAHRAFSLGGLPPEPEVSVDDLHAHGRAQAATAEDAGNFGERAPVVVEPSPAAWRGKTPWGGERPRPPLKMRLRWRAMRLLGRAMRFPPISHPVEQGDVLRLAGREWFVLHTPGHTNDHFCLHNREDGVFLAGDHVLPSITPHISGLSLERDPLRAFFESLDLAAAQPDVKVALPAHGHPFEDLAARCEAIKVHHDERLEKVRRIAGELGPATVQAFSRKLFRERSWGSMAESETYAHLEHLRLLGDAERRTDGTGRFVYVF